MDFLNTVFAPLKITFNFDPDTNLQARRNKAFSNHMTKSRGNNEAFQRVNRLPGNDVLNIWVVNSIDKDPETGKSPGTTGVSCSTMFRIKTHISIVFLHSLWLPRFKGWSCHTP